jgi:hypothetical protein
MRQVPRTGWVAKRNMSQPGDCLRAGFLCQQITAYVHLRGAVTSVPPFGLAQRAVSRAAAGPPERELECRRPGSPSALRLECDTKDPLPLTSLSQDAITESQRRIWLSIWHKHLH